MTGTSISGKVQTVLGPIEPDRLGVTLTHEHLLIDLMCYFQMPAEASEREWVGAPIEMDRLGRLARNLCNIENFTLLDETTAIDEVLHYKHAGGGSLVETTSIGAARDPLALARISRATGLNIIMGGGYYVPVSHPPDMDARTEDSIAEEIIRDVTTGVRETGVRSGIIGELGNTYPLGDNEKKVLRAAAHAQAETGAPITIHPDLDDRSAPEILDVLVAAGADPRQVVMGHLGMSVRDMTVLSDLADTGCFLEYDQIGSFEDTSEGYFDFQDFVTSDIQEMEFLEFLIGRGHLDQLLVSQDVCRKMHLTRNGGKGYAHILESIVPRMRRRGFTAAQIDSILVENPHRALTFR